MKIAILTALCGTEYRFPNHSVIHNEKNIDYIAFCDKPPHNTGVWQLNPIFDFTIDDRFKNRRNARVFKTFAPFVCAEYDYVIWCDSTHEVKMHPYEMIDRYLNGSDIAMFRHFSRVCVYHEANVVRSVNYDTEDNIERQVKDYKLRKYPENYGLYETGGYIFRNTPAIKVMCLSWWEQISRYSSRDQISLPYVLWEHGIEPNIIEGSLNGIGENNVIPRVVN